MGEGELTAMVFTDWRSELRKEGSQRNFDALESYVEVECGEIVMEEVAELSCRSR